MAYKFTKEDYPYDVKIGCLISVDEGCTSPRGAALNYLAFVRDVIAEESPYLSIEVEDRITGQKWNIYPFDKTEDYKL